MKRLIAPVILSLSLAGAVVPALASAAPAAVAASASHVKPDFTYKG